MRNLIMQWERLMGSMLHTIGTKESERRKADLRNSTYYRAVNRPEIKKVK